MTENEHNSDVTFHPPAREPKGTAVGCGIWNTIRMTGSPREMIGMVTEPRARPKPPGRAPRLVRAVGLCFLLAACNSVTGMFSRGQPQGAVAPGPQENKAPQTASTETIGSGEAKVALILPLTQASGPSSVGISLRNAAELAYFEA